MELQVIGKSKGKVQGSDLIFAAKFNEGLVHQAVTSYRTNARAGTKKQKTRSDVSGGGAKPWRQKGMGRARAGTTRSPLWRSGGVTFAARPKKYDQKMNRKAYQRAMASILSQLVREERLLVTDALTLAEPKTRQLEAELNKLNVTHVCIVTAEKDDNLTLAARNMATITVIDATHLNPVDLIAYEKVLVTADAIKKIEEQLS